MKAKKGIALLLTLAILCAALPLNALAAVREPSDDFCPRTADGKHVWSNWNVDKLPTCSETGKRSRECRYCRYTQTETLKKEPHNYGSWKVTKEATCSKEGSRQRECRDCGHVDKQTIEKKEHTWGAWTVIREATCSEKGRREHTCRVCGRKEAENVKKLPHAWADWVILTEATDHSSGVRSHVCTLCQTMETENYDPEGTLRRKDKGEDVRLLNSELICYGAMKGRPGDVFNANTEKAVKKVQQAEGFAADGVAWPQTRAVLGHQFGEWETVTEMSDFSAGLRRRTCSRCKYTEKEELYPSPMYRQGDTGDGVAALQQALTDAGYKPGPVDGSFGNKTKKAVQAFQKKNRLKQDGIAWPGVLKMLGVPETGESVSVGDDFLGSSGSVVLKNPTATPPPGGLTGADTAAVSLGPVERSLTVVEKLGDDGSWYTGAIVPIKMRLTLDRFDDYFLTEIKCADGDSYKQENWMFYALSAGQSYDFTYYLSLDPEKLGWKDREVSVRLRSRSAKSEEEEYVTVGPPFTYPTVTLEKPPKKTINDFAAYLYLDVPKDGYAGAAYSGENMEIPFIVDSDGNTRIRDIRLVCEQQMLGETYDTWSMKLGNIDAGDSFPGVAHMPAKRAKDAVSTGYSLKVYLTGMYYNQKGEREDVESQPVTLDYNILEQSWNPAQLNMVYVRNPVKSAYYVNDTVTLTFTVTSDGTEAVRDVSVGLAGSYAADKETLGEPDPVDGGKLMEPGAKATATYTYRIRQEDLEKEAVEIDFEATGTAAASGLPVRSPRATMTLPVTDEPPEEQITLSASAVSPKETYPTGVVIPCRVTMTPHTTQPIKWITIYATGENRRAGSYQTTSFHDFGHGVKGFVCWRSNAPSMTESTETVLDVNIPAYSRKEGVYYASWTAEAELKDGTIVRSNTAYLPMYTDVEKAELSVSHVPGPYPPGSSLMAGLNLKYTGDRQPPRFRAYYRLRYKGDWKPAGIIYMDDEGNGSVRIDLPLNEEDIVNGKWEYLFGAEAIGRTGTLTTDVICEALDVGDPLPVVEEVKVTARIISEPADPEKGWQPGEKVLIRAEAAYTGGSVYMMSMIRDAGGQEYKGVAFETAGMADEFEVTLTEDMAEEGYFCTYIFAVYNEGEEEPIRESRMATVWIRLGVPVATENPDDEDDSGETGDGSGEETGENPESGAPAEGDGSSGEEDGENPESGAPAEGEGSPGEEAAENPEESAPSETEPPSGEEKKPEKTSIFHTGLPGPEAESPTESGLSSGVGEKSSGASESVSDVGGWTSDGSDDASNVGGWTSDDSDGASGAGKGTSGKADGTADTDSAPADLPDGDELETLLSGGSTAARSDFQPPQELANSVLEAPSGAKEDYCFGAVTGLTENLTEIEVTFCKKLSDLPGAGKQPLTDLTEAETLWTEALNAEYDALKEAAEIEDDTEEAAALEEARELFGAELETLRAESTQEMVLFRIMLQTAAVCEISHTAEDPLAALLELMTPADEGDGSGEGL